ncbi:MAG: membrane protein of unknown function [Candidatus Thorarchaeota archaeon]|nr:MAG: membrane protein of unknown function [Candidatus Thorarchaeota archaeon]
MVDLIQFTASIISAMVSIIAGGIFFNAYSKEKKTARLLWAIAFLLYAIGHIVNAGVVGLEIPATSEEGTFLLWFYVALSGAGTTGIVLYATVPFLTRKAYVREILTLLFVGAYLIGSALFAFVLPDENLFAFINPATHVQVLNMSWWVVELLIPASFFIGIVFLRHYSISKTQWGLWIGLSFLIYAIILFIWPIADLKWLFYIIRTVSVAFLGYGGILLARD